VLIGYNAVLMASNYCLLNNGTEKVSIVTDVFLPFYEMKPAVFLQKMAASSLDLKERVKDIVKG